MLLLYVLWLFCEWGCREMIGYLTRNHHCWNAQLLVKSDAFRHRNEGFQRQTMVISPAHIGVIHQKWGLFTKSEETVVKPLKKPLLKPFFLRESSTQNPEKLRTPELGITWCFFFDVILWACMFNQILTGGKPSIIQPFSPQRVYGLRWLPRSIPFCVRTLLRFRATLCLRHATRRWIGWTCCAMPLSKVGPRPRWIFHDIPAPFEVPTSKNRYL